MLWTGHTIGPDDALYSNAARGNGLELALVLAVVETESSFRVAAFRPEPQWRYFWNVETWKPFRETTAAENASERPPADFPGPALASRTSEWWGQQASFGLMQVMGGVARQLGCTCIFLTELCGFPELALSIGCRFLAMKIKAFGDTDDAIAAYNAGSPIRRMDAAGRTVFANQEYVDRVTTARARYRAQQGG